MSVRRSVLSLFMMLGLCAGTVHAQTITVAAGAGYRAVVDELAEIYARENGVRVERIYGNMGQVTAQARSGGVVDLVVGDKRYLDGASLHSSAEYEVGRGRLVLAVATGVRFDSLSDLSAQHIGRIGIPDPERAMFGIAATEFLNNSGQHERLFSKLIQVGTVPQVSSYLVTGEVDVGFINETDARAINDRIAAYQRIDEELYSPILIMAKIMNDAPNPAEARRFGRFLAGRAAREAVEQHGM